MNNAQQMLLHSSLTMSSTDIATLTGKQKKHVHKDIKDQLLISLYGLKDGQDLDHEQIQGITVVLDNRGYWSEVLLDRYHTDILISGYEVKYRAAIVKRWHELESAQPKLPNFSDEIEAAKAWIEAKKSEKAALALVTSQKATIKHKDELICASNEASIKAGEILIREFVKSNDIIDLGEKQFYAWLREQGIVSEDNEPYQRYVNSGYFRYKPSDKPYGGKVRYTLMVTPRGKVWLAAKYMAYIDAHGFSALGNGEAA
ncbi:phage antirepressor KilAC domain-containing protein [Methylovulum psychrotolerans]|uniref:Antirepressor protein C-terminal domain-containing protein n=1 Tax=Methylovulum psychrotolerans TaxID=1704499 RepID=A0A2S5CQ93_9GAMM|nr:phage antirepressor KilAC domain-containing protein [Methylovulum psychrotolerans]POZ52989.1 hypothetical protein AADEFJLK_01605 [Methylovulum psychrotolerans]